MSSGPTHDLRTFAWRLAPLRAMAEWARDRAAQGLSHAVREEQAAAAACRELSQHYQRQSGFVPASAARMFDGALHAQRLAYLAHLRLQCRDAEDSHAHRREQLAQCRTQCSDRMRNLEGLQRARALALRSHVAAMSSRDAAETDRAWLARCAGAIE